MSNEDILTFAGSKKLKENNGKKFDIVLQNPPYSQRNNNNPIHFLFIDKCKKLAYKQIVVMPSRLLYTTSKNYNIWKEKLSDGLVSAEEIDSKNFNDTNMFDVAIYTFDYTKTINDISIKLKGKNEIKTKSLLYNIKEEDEILKLLNNNGNITIFNLKTNIPKTSNKDIIINDKKKLVNNIKQKSKYDNKYFLSVNIANGAMNAHYISSQCGKIFSDFDDILDDWIKRNVGASKYIVFDNKISAENCKSAMERPVLRYALYNVQDDQNMNNKCYKYIPAIDWSDDKVKTDEGLLEVCGCPKDKCKEYADYCKKIIEKIDKRK